MNQKGLTVIFLSIGIFFLLLGGVGLWFYFSNFGPLSSPYQINETSQTEQLGTESEQAGDNMLEEAPDYNEAREKYDLSETQLEILSRVDSSRL